MSADRRDRLRARLSEAGADALVVTSLVNVRYLTGFTGSNARVVVGAEAGSDVLLTDDRYATQAPREVGDLPVVITAHEVIERTLEAVAGVDRVGFEAHDLPWQTAEELRAALVDAGQEAVALEREVERLREVKDGTEIDALREACRVSVDALGALLEQLRPGLIERDVATVLEAAMRERGAEDRAFDTIVASGPNSAVPHHRAGTRVIGEGDLVKIDFGARVAGYHADCTRTVAVGDPGEELVAIHALVVRAQAAAVAAAVAGADLRDVDAACRDVITEAGHGEHFVHGTGHGIGLQIHEDPFLGSQATGTLRPGMAITIEPGIYLPGVGGVRIEDSVVVTADGPPDVLTTAPRDLLVL